MKNTYESVMARVSPEPMSGCWLWEGALSQKGYANVKWHGRVVRVHRLLYEREHGPIPPGLEPDHRCRVRCCVNFDHIRLLTHRDNCLEPRVQSPIARNARKTSCHRGHAFVGSNVYRTKDGRRDCRACWKVRYWQARAA